MSILGFDECALTLMLVFFVSTLIHKEYRTRTNKIMFAIIIMIALTVLGDLISGHNDNMMDPSPFRRFVSYVANYVYFLTHNSVMPLYILYIYSSIDIWHIFMSKKMNRIIMMSLVGIDTIILLLNGWAINVFYIDEVGKYNRGTWIFIFYVVAAFYGIWAFVALVKYRKFMQKEKLYILLFLYLVIIGSMLVQLLNGNILVEGFGMVLAVLFLLVAVRREENQIDSITGAIKYHEGIHRVTKAFESNKPISLIFIKINNFSNLKIYLGITEYNQFMKSVTQTLGRIAKENEYTAEVFHMESGLFAYLGDDIDKAKVTATAEGCRKTFGQAMQIDGFTVFTDVSICIAYCPEDLEEFSSVLKLATTFHATMPANQQICYYSDYKEDREFRVRNELDSIIQRALDRNGLRVYYQPVYSIEQNSYVALEALIRLRDKEYGFISPDTFLPVAEQNGTINEIGSFVFEEVCKFINSIDMKRLGLEYIAINLSVTECMSNDLIERIKTFLEKYGISPRQIAFEIEESPSVINPELIDSNIHKLHDMGFRIILGGYGSGYSDIRRIIRLPIDQFKLDRKLVSMVNEPKMWTIISETIRSMKEMGKEIIIVGVENEEAARKFCNLEASLLQGCSLMQGFYYCKPVPKDEIIEVIEKYL